MQIDSDEHKSKDTDKSGYRIQSVLCSSTLETIRGVTSSQTTRQDIPVVEATGLFIKDMMSSTVETHLALPNMLENKDKLKKTSQKVAF